MALPSRIARHIAVLSLGLGTSFYPAFGVQAFSSTVPASSGPTTQAATVASPAVVLPADESQAQSHTQTRAQRRAQRRAARKLATQQSAAQPPSPPVPSDAAQRLRDQKLLDAQKAQSAETARENDAVTEKGVRDQQKVQAEPRIQDAPGPGSQPLPGDAIVPPVQPADPPRIQDAPGPAQTLPKAPPPPSAAPQS